MKRKQNYITLLGLIFISALVFMGAIGGTTNFLGTNDADNAASTSSVAANRDGSLLERNEYLLDILVDDETTNYIGTNDADNAAVTSSVAANEDGSVLERLEQIQEGINKGAGAALPAGKSLFDIIGETYTDDGGADHLDDVASHLNLLSKYFADGDGDFATGRALPSNTSVVDIIGNFTGPYNGAAQDDNIKASLDLAHTDLDAILAKTPANMAYTATVTSSADTTHSVYSSMTGYGDGYFVTGWTMIVIYDAGGANAAPEGEVVDITAYTSSSGTFTHGATTQLAASDVVLFARDEIVSVFQKALPATPVTNSLAYKISKWLADGDGDFATGTALGSNKSLVDVLGNDGTGTTQTGDRDAANLADRIDAISLSLGIVTAAGADGFEDDGTGGDLYDMLNSTDANSNNFTGDGGTDYNDNVFSFLEKLSTYIADGDGDFATGSAMPSNKSIYDITGAYTADGGADDEDTIMAHLDLIYADTDNIDDMGEQAISKTISTIANGNNDLFTVTGGPIKILEIIGIVTTEIGSESCDIYYTIDPTTPAGNTDFGTDGDGLVIDGDTVGTLYTWDGVIANDLIATTNGVALGLSAAGSSGLIVPAGSIEMTAVHDGTCDGAIVFYMRYIPLVTGVTVAAAS